jgi:two-component sensor histidine kinase
LIFIFMTFSFHAQISDDADSLLFLKNSLKKEAKDTSRIRTLILINDYYLDRHAEEGSLDSADLYLKRAAKLNDHYHIEEFKNSIDMYTANLYCFRNPTFDAKRLFLPMINRFKERGDKIDERFAWGFLESNLPSVRSSIPDHITCDQHVVKLSRQLNYNKSAFLFLRREADLNLQMGNLDSAESDLLQIVREPKNAGDIILGSEDLLAEVYIRKGELDKALFHGLNTVKIMEANGDSSFAVTYYGRLINIYGILGNSSLNIYWTKRAINYISAKKKPFGLFVYSYDLVKALIAQGKPEEALRFILDKTAKYTALSFQDERAIKLSMGYAYFTLKKYDLSEKSYLELLKLDKETKSSDHVFDMGSDNLIVGDFYLNTHQYGKAKGYLVEALKYYNFFGAIDNIRNAHLSLFKADSALGDYRSAIAHLQENNRLKDSIFNVSKNKQIEQLNVTFQTEEREKDLKLVKNKESLEEVKLQHTESTKNWIIAGSSLLLLISGLLYRQNRLKRIINTVITNKNEAITLKNDVITQKNELLQNLVKEKEWLLKEVHHRTKNNLHTVICLLESQAAYLENDALKAIEVSQHRIYTMSLIHQTLYQSEDIKTIDMALFVPELVLYLIDSFGVSGKIHIHLDVDKISLNAGQAIPLALIINEAITNSIKYAFPDERKGEISICLTDECDEIILEITDNGIGMAQDIRTGLTHSLGLELMKGLTKQLNGNVRFENKNGVTVIVVFKHDTLNDSYFHSIN